MAHTPTRRRLAVVAGATAALATIAATVGSTVTPGLAGTVTQTRVVSANPVNWAPHIYDGTVNAYARVGTTIIVGGTFTQVRQIGSSTIQTRPYILAFTWGTGKILTGFRPKLDGEVKSLEAGANNTVYVGGSFKHVNGVANRGLTRLYLSTGGRVGSFKGATIDYGTVAQMVRRGTRLYIAGSFTKVAGVSRTALARLNTDTGTVDPGFKFNITTTRDGVRRIVGMAVNPADTRLVIDGDFTYVNGHRRYQIAMINTSTATLTGWATSRYGDVCNPVFDTYMKDVDFSPDGKYFVVVTTGGPRGNTTLCDSAARWETARSTTGQQPTWVNWTGGDTLLSVDATGVAVYVGGHQRWMNNPYGSDSAGPGAVSRPGLAALSPSTGRALSWNPTRNPLGYGTEIILATPSGLLTGSDTSGCGHEHPGRMCIFPLPS